MKLTVVLLVLLIGLRRHPQGQHVRTTDLTEKWIYCLLTRNRNAGPTPMATGVGVTCSPGKGCIGPESTTAQYVAYGETTVCTYLYILYISPVWIPSTTLLLNTKRANMHGQDNQHPRWVKQGRPIIQLFVCTD